LEFLDGYLRWSAENLTVVVFDTGMRQLQLTASSLALCDPDPEAEPAAILEAIVKVVGRPVKSTERQG
jgi:hypothetical protein